MAPSGSRMDLVQSDESPSIHLNHSGNNHSMSFDHTVPAEEARSEDGPHSTPDGVSNDQAGVSGDQVRISTAQDGVSNSGAAQSMISNECMGSNLDAENESVLNIGGEQNDREVTRSDELGVLGLRYSVAKISHIFLSLEKFFLFLKAVVIRSFLQKRKCSISDQIKPRQPVFEAVLRMFFLRQF
ncbi:hypothetical protein GQ457_02G034700 [Hibiscus cannabinus]